MTLADDVELVTQTVGADQYKITAKAQFESQPEAVWPLLLNWERFIEVGLPGMTSNFG